ncbi:MAG: transcriptional coactivator p15/PC4 family protein [Pseudomonadota bacterium]
MPDIQKNAREVIRVELSEFKGHHLLNIRVWYDAGDGDMRPSNKGLSVQLGLIPDVQAAIADVERQAMAKGLIKTDQGAAA